MHYYTHGQDFSMLVELNVHVYIWQHARPRTYTRYSSWQPQNTAWFGACFVRAARLQAANKLCRLTQSYKLASRKFDRFLVPLSLPIRRSSLIWFEIARSAIASYLPRQAFSFKENMALVSRVPIRIRAYIGWRYVCNLQYQRARRCV
jgi:hypothetical protein